MLNFKIDSEKCVKCGACVNDCLSRIIKMEDGSLPAVSTENEDKCIKCQHCYAICPTGALSIFGLDPEKDSTVLTTEILPTPESMAIFARARRSIRKYKQENVDSELIDQMLYSTANAPTAANTNQLRFDVIRDVDKMNEIRKGLMAQLVEFRSKQELPPHAAYLEGFIEPWKKYNVDSIFRTAPHALIVSTPKGAMCGGIVDVSIALSYFELIAQSNGLGTTWCGLLKQCMEILPDYKEMLLTEGVEGTKDYYCMLFGKPAIKYARTVNKNSVARINYI